MLTCHSITAFISIMFHSIALVCSRSISSDSMQNEVISKWHRNHQVILKWYSYWWFTSLKYHSTYQHITTGLYGSWQVHQQLWATARLSKDLLTQNDLHDLPETFWNHDLLSEMYFHRSISVWTSKMDVSWCFIPLAMLHPSSSLLPTVAGACTQLPPQGPSDMSQCIHIPSSRQAHKLRARSRSSELWVRPTHEVISQQANTVRLQTCSPRLELWWITYEY